MERGEDIAADDVKAVQVEGRARAARLFTSLDELKNFVLWCRANGVGHFESPEASFVVQPAAAPAQKFDKPKDETDEQRLERELFPT